ncbi:MAG: amino acid transporter, partial [Candidatus Hydrogenedentes bacterium]|nr:amino acid transporter [Candidatus Hydrogenedentota bacterium]
VAVSSVEKEVANGKTPLQEPTYDRDAKTAVILVNGFNGLGLHTLFSVIQLFGASFRSFAFIQVGVVDAGNFKGTAELGRLQEHIENELDHYVQYMKKEGFYAESFCALGTDIVEEIAEFVPRIQERFSRAVFFGGQLVFPEETAFTRLLHNYIVFAVQRRLYGRGIPFVILPIRI